MPELNVDTKHYNEQFSGIMICGYNWGVGLADKERGTSESFFSDERYGNRYRNRIIEWFDLWGYRLEREPGNESFLEKSIVQTNWLPSQSASLAGNNVVESCIQNVENFALHVSHFRPKILFLMGKNLIDALNSPHCLPVIKPIFGEGSAPVHLRKVVKSGNKKLRQFRVSFQRFKEIGVVCLPHPSGSRGLSNEYVASFSNEINEMVKTYFYGK